MRGAEAADALVVESLESLERVVVTAVVDGEELPLRLRLGEDGAHRTREVAAPVARREDHGHETFSSMAASRTYAIVDQTSRARSRLVMRASRPSMARVAQPTRQRCRRRTTPESRLASRAARSRLPSPISGSALGETPRSRSTTGRSPARPPWVLDSERWVPGKGKGRVGGGASRETECEADGGRGARREELGVGGSEEEWGDGRGREGKGRGRNGGGRRGRAEEEGGGGE